MHKSEAYAVLSAELEKWAKLPFRELVSQVGKPPTTKIMNIENELVEIDVRVSWVKKRGSVQVLATARGPNWQRLAMLEERIVVHPPRGSE